MAVLNGGAACPTKHCDQQNADDKRPERFFCLFAMHTTAIALLFLYVGVQKFSPMSVIIKKAAPIQTQTGPRNQEHSHENKV